jgi:hypothetical protein
LDKANQSALVHGLGKEVHTRGEFIIRYDLPRDDHHAETALTTDPASKLQTIHAALGQVHVCDNSLDVRVGLENLQSFLG